ncbi:AbrB/MazE/SpoVT family DNA-binding domain-containing protein [Dactylosporangium salmoneum]|uniref:SpoVT-AbrB domain-containing protein n=1 Tax=Dactylosporangium salmoneum TaxID=53361 RepID=A0ABP5V9K5_9ACTN
MTVSHPIDAAAGPPQVPPALPMPALPELSQADVGYWLITTLDDAGRLANRSPVRALGWTAGQRLQASVHPAIGYVSRADTGPLAVAARGHVRLPAAMRHRLGLACGDRVLVAVRLEQDALVVYPLPIVASLLTAFEASAGITSQP